MTGPEFNPSFVHLFILRLFICHQLQVVYVLILEISIQ
jgi:hypothetical protein